MKVMAAQIAMWALWFVSSRLYNFACKLFQWHDSLEDWAGLGPTDEEIAEYQRMFGDEFKVGGTD